MKKMITADGFEVRATKMFYSSPWENIMLGDVNREWVFGEYLRKITAAIPHTGLVSWHYLDDNREEPEGTHLYGVAVCLEGDVIPDVDDCVCGSWAFISTIVHVGIDQTIQEAIEARVGELVWTDIATNWDF